MKQSNSEFWNTYFRTYDILNYFIPYEAMLKSVIKELSVNDTDHLLDLGCGTGNLLRFIPKQTVVVAADFSAEALSLAQKKEAPINCTLLNLNLLSTLPFEDNTFNKIAMVNVLYAFSSKVQHDILCEVKRIIKTGGKVTLVVPKPNASRFDVFKVHIKGMIREKGVNKTAGFLFFSVYPLFLMNKYNRLIEGRAKNKDYCLWERLNFIKLLKSLGFYNIATSDIYANQAFMYSFNG